MPGPTGALAEVADGNDGFPVVAGIVWPDGCVAFIGVELPRDPNLKPVSCAAFPAPAGLKNRNRAPMGRMREPP